MTMTTFSSRKFNQDTASAKRAAKDGPVFITVRGEPEHVLLSMEYYAQLTKRQGNLIECLATPKASDIQLDIPKLNKQWLQPADFS